MIITKKHLSRRTFLRGTFGAAMALPMLDAMVPALTAQAQTAATTPFRFGAIYMPNGVYPDTWHPRPSAPTSSSSRSCSRSKAFRDQLVTVSKMKAPWGESVHLGASSAFLNGVGPVGARDGSGDAFGKIQSKKTLDQYIADMVAGDTPLRSIEVGHRGHGHGRGRLRRLPLHVLQRALLARRLQPAADRHQPARHVRADVRRDRLEGTAHGTSQGEAEPARLRDGGNVEAAQHARRTRQGDPRRVSEQHPPGRAAARSDGDAARHDHRHAGSADWSAGSVRRSHDDHLRPDAPGVPGRHQPRVHVHDRPRGERPRLRAHRDPRDAPQHLASRQRRREARQVREARAPIRS